MEPEPAAARHRRGRWLMRTPSIVTLGLAALALAGLGVACAVDSESSIDAPLPGGASFEGRALHERDFAGDSAMRTTFGTSVVLALEPKEAAPSSGDTGTPGVDVIPYTVKTPESVRLCAPDLGPTVADVALVAKSDGRTVLHLTAGTPCAEATLDAGEYDALITRAASADGTTVPVFVHEALAGNAATPQCGPETAPNDPLSGAPDDLWNLYAEGAAIKSNSLYLAVDLGVGDFASYRAFQLTRAADGNVSIYDSRYENRIGADLAGRNVTLEKSGIGWKFTPVADGAPWTYRVSTGEYVRGNYKEYAWQRSGSGLDKKIGLASSYDYPYAWTRITLGPRLVKNGGELKTLRRGEAALYSECGFGGQALVLNDSNVVTSPATVSTLYLTRAIRVGCDTTLSVYFTNDPNEKPMRFSDTTDNALVPCQSFPTQRIERMVVTHTRQLTIETKTCTRCNLSRVDLHGLDLSGLTITGGSLEGAHFDSTKLAGATFDGVSLKDAVFDDATLDGAKLQGASGAPLEGANARFDRATFSGATLSNARFGSGSFRGSSFPNATLSDVGLGGAALDGASFAGATLAGVDFSRTNVAAATFDAAPKFALPSGQTLVAAPCDVARQTNVTLSRFAGATVRFAQVPVDSWRYLDLSDAQLDTPSLPAAAKTLAGKTLCGLGLTGVNLASFDVRGARFDRSDLKKSNFTNAGCQAASFANTALDYATFEYADLTDANLDNVTTDGASATANVNFSGSLFRPASMNQARLTKVVMNDAIVRIPAGKHTGVLMDGGQFLRSDFTNNDLSGLSMNNAQFSQAIFVGASLNGTKLGVGASFSHAVFCKTHVKGAIFDQANLADAFFPQAAGATTTDTNTGQPTPCDPVQLDGAPSLEAAVSSSSARCPNGAVVGPAGCKGTDWILTNPIPRDICPMTTDSPLLKCAPCTDNCACRSKQCVNGKCALCPPP
jgi:uncharacterized protein YjbI with pentapeptide repeats